MRRARCPQIAQRVAKTGAQVSTVVLHNHTAEETGYATRVVWQRVPKDMSLRDALRRSGPQPEDTPHIDEAIRQSLGEYCLTFRDQDHPL